MTVLAPAAPARPARTGHTRGGSGDRGHGGERHERRGTLAATASTVLLATIVFQPVLHPTGPGNSSPIDVIILALLALTAVWAATDRAVVRVPYVWPVGLMVVGGLGAAIVSPLGSSTALPLFQDIILLTYAAAIASLGRRPGMAQRIAGTWAVSAACYAVVLIVGSLLGISAITGVVEREGNRALFTFGDPNYAGMYWTLSIFMVYTAQRPGRRWLRWLAIGLLLWAVVLTESNGSVVELLVGCSVLLVVRTRRRHGVPAAVAVFVLLGLGAVEVNQQLPAARTWALQSGQPILVNSLGRSDESSAQRDQLVNEMVELYDSTGPLGYGAGATKELLTERNYPYAKEAHDDYLASLFERGPIAVVGVLWLLVAAGWRARRALRAPPGGTHSVERPVGLVAAAAAIAVAATYYEVLHFRFVWIVLALLAVAADANRPARARPEPAVLTGDVRRLERRDPDLAGTGSPVPPGGSPILTPSSPGSRIAAARSLGRRSIAGNLGAQIGALASVSVATLVVVRLGGAAVLGDYTLLRVLPWLTGVLVSCGAPVSAAYFVANRADKQRVMGTLLAIVITGALASAAVWLALTPGLHRLFFSDAPLQLIVWSTGLVITQTVTVWAKACCQGNADMAGANLLIVGEEFVFLPAYAVVLGLGFGGLRAVVLAMLLGGVTASCVGLWRLRRTGLLRGMHRPSRTLARSVAGYGARAQVGNLLWLVNLRLDFLILDAIAGPAVLGVYAIATKYAEVMRLPATAINYVLYPRFARATPDDAHRDARKLYRPAVAVTAALGPLLAAAALPVIPTVFGTEFHAAVLPACVLLAGLCVEGAAAVSSAYLCGTGRPGANSLGMLAGVTVTVALDALLIPRSGALGAAIASTAAYLVTTSLLTGMSLRRRAEQRS